MGKEKILRGLFSAVLLCAVFIGGFSVGREMGVSVVGVDLSDSKTNRSVSLIVDFGDGSEKVFSRQELTNDDSVFGVLKRALQSANIPIAYKDYGGDLGVFIEGIGGKQGGSEMWWQYYVNGEYGKIGVSNFKPSSGDVIQFKLSKSKIE